jgi:hypothetical protein
MRFSDIQLLRIVGWVTLAALLAGMMMSANLWQLERNFPVLPIFGNQPFIDAWLDKVLVALAILAYASFLLFRKAFLLAVFIGALLVVLLQDYMRLQPWVYQYLLICMLVGLGILQKSLKEPLNSLRFILIAIYFYAGLFKINSTFFELAGITYLSFLTPHVPKDFMSIVVILGGAVPFIEMSIAVGLLTKTYRKLALIAALGLHAFIIVFVSIRLNWNPVIIPWNIAMMVMLLLLFPSSSEYLWKDVLLNKMRPSHMALVLLVGMMPLFHFLGLWDTYPSFDLYSYRGTSVKIEWTPEERDAFLKAYHLNPSDYPKIDSNFRLDDWSYRELGVPIYPEKRVLQRIVKELCDKGIVKNSVAHLGPVYFEENSDETIRCEDLN